MPTSDGVERLNKCGVLDEPLFFTVPGTIEQLSEGGRC
jgi:hypothetical protein